MLRVRARMRSTLIRPSARASGPPGQEWTPRPKARWDWAFSRSTRNSAGHSKRRGSRLAAPLSSITGVPAAMSTPPMRRRPLRHAEVGLHRALDPQGLLEEARDEVAVAREARSCSSGCSARCFSAAASRRAVVSWPAAKRKVAVRTTDGDLRRGAVGVGGEREVGEHVLARLAPPVLDVLREPDVEPGERVLAHAALLALADRAGRPAQPEALLEALVVLLRHAEEVGDRQHGEGLRVRGDELAVGRRRGARRAAGRRGAT